MELTDKMKVEILKLSGKELYDRIYQSFNQGKIDKQILIESFAFWLNQHKVRHDQPFIKFQKREKIIEDGKERTKLSEILCKNEGEPKLYWEKFDPEISVQTIKNEFELAWNKNKGYLEQAVEETFEIE